MSSPESHNLQPTVVLQHEFHDVLNHHIEDGFEYMVAVNPPIQASAHDSFARPYGLHIGTRNEQTGVQDVYVHSTNDGVLQTGRLILFRGNVFKQMQNAHYAQLSDQDIYYLYRTFCLHGPKDDAKGGMQGSSYDQYFAGLEARLTLDAVEHMQRYYRLAREYIRLAEGSAFYEHKIRNFEMGAIGGFTWLQLYIRMRDAVSVQVGDTTLTSDLGELQTSVVAFAHNEEVDRFTIEPRMYKTVNKPVLNAVGGERVLIQYLPDVRAELPIVDARHRARAMSDINRILAGSTLIDE